MADVASRVVHEVLGRRVEDVDAPIINYIINVLADDDFDFGADGDGAFDVVGELLVDSGCVQDYAECRSFDIHDFSLVVGISFKMLHDKAHTARYVPVR
ncbi:hypothetical protein BHE74_00032035 [Ensete ventricosum]|nr:hypothetical protein BHE74_00032035 [Ensete ventricosum]